MSDKRMIGNYEIFAAMSVGDKEIVMGENPEAEAGTKYMCAYCERFFPVEQYDDIMSSDDYVEILQLYCERLKEATDKLKEEVKWEKSLASTVVPTSGYVPITDEDNLRGKVVVIAPQAFGREYQRATRQYQYVTGGFGASPNSRGSACFCVNLFDGEKGRFDRRQVLGIADPEQLPTWAKAGLDSARCDEKKGREAR